jgi:hypothetical protein
MPNNPVIPLSAIAGLLAANARSICGDVCRADRRI